MSGAYEAHAKRALANAFIAPATNRPFPAGYFSLRRVFKHWHEGPKRETLQIDRRFHTLRRLTPALNQVFEAGSTLVSALLKAQTSWRNRLLRSGNITMCRTDPETTHRATLQMSPVSQRFRGAEVLLLSCWSVNPLISPWSPFSKVISAFNTFAKNFVSDSGNNSMGG